MPRTRHGPGYYLALTFGTLLSSQGADAQKVDPLGLRLRRLVRLYSVLRIGVTRGSHRAGLPAARRRQNGTRPDGDPPGVLFQRPRKLSIPTVSPGRPAISRTARRTPGMNEARS